MWLVRGGTGGAPSGEAGAVANVVEEGITVPTTGGAEVPRVFLRNAAVLGEKLPSARPSKRLKPDMAQGGCAPKH